MSDAHRSGCPINLTLEILGDRWSLLVIRDMMFGNRRHFRELLGQSEEGIASNILADRLKRLMAAGMITRADDPSHKQKAIYSLTDKAIQRRRRRSGGGGRGVARDRGARRRPALPVPRLGRRQIGRASCRERVS
jgi:DNA-binding HxlR family transcriptional regulator